MRPLAYDLAALCAVALVAGCVWAYSPRLRRRLSAERRHRADLRRMTGR